MTSAREMTMSELVTKLALEARALQDESKAKIAAMAQVAVGLVKREIIAHGAVDTGTMLNSTTAKKTAKLSYLVGPTVTYAAAVALGTSRMRARPFHVTAADKLQVELDKLGEDLGDLDI